MLFHIKRKKSKNNTKFKLAIPYCHAEMFMMVLVQGFEKTNSLYNRVIHSIDIEFHVGFAVAVPKTQLSLLQVYVIQDMGFNYRALFTHFCIIPQCQN